MTKEPKLRFPGNKEPWEPVKAGKAFANSRSKGREGLPIYSVTLDRGMVRRDSLGREIEADAADGANLLARSGDIAYNMMRMWQGAVGRAPEECMVSPAYVVLVPTEDVSTEFFAIQFKSPRMLDMFRVFSQGLTSDRLRLYFDDFAQIPLLLPPSAEQKEIAKFFKAMDDRAMQLKKQHTLLKKYKRGVLEAIFEQNLRLNDEHGNAFPDWQEAIFDEVAELRNWKHDPGSATETVPCVELEHVSQETGRLLGQIDSSQQKSLKNRFAKNDVIFGKLRPYLRKYLKAPFKGACSTEFWVLNGKKVSNDFLFYLVQSEGFITAAKISSGSKMPRADWSVVSACEVEYPSPDEQVRIASFLGSIDAKIGEVEDCLTALIRYRKGLVQQMLV